MSPFVTFQDVDANGELQNYILQREFPHYVGKITSVNPGTVFVGQPILGYNLWIVFSGTLRGNFIPSYKDVQKEIETVFLEMSNWFYKSRVLANPKKYKRYVQGSVQ